MNSQNSEIQEQATLSANVLPPGTLLQLMYLKRRLGLLQPGYFIEIGPGAGEITAILLQLGWVGASYDYDEETCARLRKRFAQEVSNKKLTIFQGDFIKGEHPEKADLIISSMVMEHFDDNLENAFLEKVMKLLGKSGKYIAFVPASMKHWGVEDDIAGHYRRYDRKKISAMLDNVNATLLHLAGLTYPLSNMLLPVSNFLVKRAESKHLKLDMLERTKHSGKRNVLFKTTFPAALSIFLNEFTMLPLYWLQLFFVNNESCLVLYFEAQARQ